MDKYYEIAAAYFNEFEGVHLYPRLKSWVWAFWAAGLAGFLQQSWQLLIHSQRVNEPIFYGSVFILMVASVAADEHKNKTLKAAHHLNPNMKAARVRSLEKHTGFAAHQFLQVAQEIDQLRDLRQRYGIRPLSIRDLFPIPWPKGQFLMHALTLLGVLAALLSLVFPEIAEEAKDQLTGEVIGKFIGYFLLYLIFSIIIYPNAMYVWRSLKNTYNTWRARLHKSTSGSTVHLEYLVNHLVQFHHPHQIIDTAAARPYRKRNMRPTAHRQVKRSLR